MGGKAWTEQFGKTDPKTKRPQVQEERLALWAKVLREDKEELCWSKEVRKKVQDILEAPITATTLNPTNHAVYIKTTKYAKGQARIDECDLWAALCMIFVEKSPDKSFPKAWNSLQMNGLRIEKFSMIFMCFGVNTYSDLANFDSTFKQTRRLIGINYLGIEPDADEVEKYKQIMVEATKSKKPRVTKQGKKNTAKDDEEDEDISQEDNTAQEKKDPKAKAEEEKKKQDAEAKARAKEEKKKQDAEAKARAEEEKKKQDAEAKARAKEEKKKQDAEAEKEKQDAEAKAEEEKKAEEETKRKGGADLESDRETKKTKKGTDERGGLSTLSLESRHSIEKMILFAFEEEIKSFLDEYRAQPQSSQDESGRQYIGMVLRQRPLLTLFRQIPDENSGNTNN